MKDDPGLGSFPGVLAAIRDLAADNRSGAAEILGQAADVFELLTKAAGGGDPKFVAAVGSALLKAQPDMAPIANLVASAQAAVDSAMNSGQALMDASLAAREYVEWAIRAAEAAARQAAELIELGSSILTHSRSSTVMKAFRLALRQGRSFNLFVTESRPIMEGRGVAAEAAELGASVTLIADGSAALIMDSVDLVIVGADKGTPRSFVNKIGTRMIALAARERGRPLSAVCDTSKFDTADSTSLQHFAGHEPDELWPGAPERVRVLNLYFEETPLSLLTGVITEDG